MMGFFSPTDFTSKRIEIPLIPKCGACGLFEKCRTPKMPVAGEGRKGILVVGEAPDGNDDNAGGPFMSAAGDLLRRSMWDCGVDLDRDCWSTNALICRPTEDRVPSSDEIDYCRPNLKREIDRLKPRMIMPLGPSAVRSVIGPLWREATGSISQWVGWQIPSQTYNSWIVPNYPPSFILSAEENNQYEAKVAKIWFDRYMSQQLTTFGRPWDIVPDYASNIEIIYNPYDAAVWIRDKLKWGGVFSFDYETNCLKPDSHEARIVCCSICWNGVETISFSWVGEAITAAVELIHSKYPKIGANLKFEDRWTRRFYGKGMVNPVWDVVLVAHLLDNRKDITSVKFQAFVLLGQLPWDEAIRPYLGSPDDTGNGLNRIHEVDLRALLIYCGIDSLVEYKIAEIQRKKVEEML